ncbi:MAG: tetratricopeptide repeat protein [Bacteroidaceae bacterium]|nr:tetratricopeptide repeat protein [Bacteroidaceae bacterium]
MERAYIHTYIRRLPARTKACLARARRLFMPAAAGRIASMAGLFALTLLLAACSSKVNTAGSRFWQKFNTKYNVFYNGKQAYKEGMQAKEKGAQDNYTEVLPLFMVGNEKNAALGKGNFETCIEKMQKAVTLHSIKKKPDMSGNKTLTPAQKLYRQRKEFNPQLKKAWLMMGEAQFQKGEFEEAAATFSYIIRLYAAEPEVAAEARTWLARCYAQIKWYYDAEDVMNRQKRDSLPPRLVSERDATMADLLIRQERFDEAMPYLESTIKHTRSKAQKGRLYFLKAQIEHAIGHDDEAYKSLGKCAKTSPVYLQKFNARIMQTEMLGQDRSKAKGMISRLKRMTHNASNKEYLDQVYYAMGNIYLAQADTASAISAYEKGREKATRSGIEKGVLLLKLGEVYWDQRKFDKAQPCFSECISMLGKDHKRYQEVMKRSKVLDELVPYTSAVYLQDSLQTLARMPEAERNAAIDRVIEALKKKEAEEKKLRRDSAAQARAAANGQEYGRQETTENKRLPGADSGDRSWYFYNPTLVNQGKQDFRKVWGNRKNEDDWRRANHTVIATSEEETEEMADSLAADSLAADSLATDSLATGFASEADSLAADPHNREYYLAQIPFTEEQMAASHDIIKDGLYNAGVIEKDKLDDFPLAEETLGRLVTEYPDASQMEDALYHMFLLYSRWNKPDEADRYRAMLAEKFPDGAMTKMITDPDFELLARYGLQMEDSLYTETYQAYRDRRSSVVNDNYATSTRRFPTGLNRPKFIFVHALNGLGTLSTDSIISELRGLVKDFPKADVAEMAGMIVNGLESGRTIGDGRYDLGSLWDRRAAEGVEGADSLKGKELTAERNVPFSFVLAYPNDSINDDRLLYEVAHFNFTRFMVRGFELTFEKDKRLTQFRVGGFNSYDEALAYARKLYDEAENQEMIKKARAFIISDANLPLLGIVASYDEYQEFYEKHYSPLPLPDNIKTLLNEPKVKTIYEDEVVPKTSAAEDGDDDAAVQDDAMPVEMEDIPVEMEDTPVEEEALPVEEEAVPSKDEPVAKEPQAPVTPTEPAAPEKAEPVKQEEPAKTEEEPAKTEEEPVKTEEQPVKTEEDDVPVEEEGGKEEEEDLPVIEEETTTEEDLPVVEEEDGEEEEEDLPIIEEETTTEEDLPVVEEEEESEDEEEVIIVE